ncbi:MAG: hypothetical protein F9K18_04575 [Thermoanaerobaculia bacterium]|nr:MAG: hypothetical protein F9K18_04575 [Thermoanaerobaculia bacterium]
MSAIAEALSYTETEIRSFLPSGWGIVRGAAGRLDPRSGRWSIEVYDSADNVWSIHVEPDAARGGRLEALRAVIDRIQRKGLGRKSVLLG